MKEEHLKDFKDHFRVFMSYTGGHLVMSYTGGHLEFLWISSTRQIRKQNLALNSDGISSITDFMLAIRVWISVLTCANVTKNAEQFGII